VRRNRTILTLVLAIGFLAPCGANEPPARRVWTVDDVTREALVYPPAKAADGAAPVLFAFHGHGGSMENAARSFRYHEVWPEAVIVYPQGLDTPGALVDPKGEKSGWQSRLGEQGDRDLAFFDSMLADILRDYSADARRVFAAGHSNGGTFTFLLWSARGKTLAGVATSGAVPLDKSARLSPKPAFHSAGRTDPLVKFAWQERAMEAIKKTNRCGQGQPWGLFCTCYPSTANAPLVTYVHPGGHEYPSEASEAIARFFREIAAR